MPKDRLAELHAVRYFEVLMFQHTWFLVHFRHFVYLGNWQLKILTDLFHVSFHDWYVKFRHKEKIPMAELYSLKWTPLVTWIRFSLRYFNFISLQSSKQVFFPFIVVCCKFWVLWNMQVNSITQMLEQMEAGITNLQAKYKEMLDPTKGEG